MQNKILSSLKIYALITFCWTNAYADATRWPIPDWETADTRAQMTSKQCIAFKNFSTENSDFKTDSLLVIKDGMVQFEYYNSENTRDKPHALWSVTKTITGALLGIAERDGRLHLDQKLSEFYPKKVEDDNYNKITLMNLLYLDTGFSWKETELDVSMNNVLNMLFGRGHEDMAIYATNRKVIKEGPSYQWNYTTGTPVITMGVLKKVYGDEYNEMPWRTLFNPLGMTSVVFEKDKSGTFIGGAGVFATPRDIAKLGYLYLNNGVWNGEVILPQEWIKKMLTPSPGYVSPGTIVKNITDDRVFGGSIWLNKKVKRGLGRPFPHAPEDMYMAIGLMGQFVIMLPSQNMIIVRTGNDNEFNSKIDEFISRSLSCFHDSKYSIGKEIPPADPEKLTFGLMMKNVKNGVQANTLQGSIAKTICSCHLVSGMGIQSCLKKFNFTFSKLLTKIEVKEEEDFSGRTTIQVKLARFARLFKLHFGNSAKAVYNPNEPEYGCTLN